MNISLSREDLSDILDALDTVADDRQEQLRYTIEPSDRDSLEAAINRANALRESIAKQMETAPEHLHIAAMVEGGLIQSVYANGDVSLDVYDLDVSDFPDEGEAEEAERRRNVFQTIAADPAYHSVY